MLGLYPTLKLIHVLGAITWLGGSASVGIMTARAAAARDRSAMTTILTQGTSYSARFAAPAMLLVLLTGIAMVGTARISPRSLWILWGLGGVVLHFAFGASVLRTAIRELVTLAHAGDVPDARVFEAGRRVSRLTYGSLALLASVVVVMVFKPTL